MSDCIVNNLIIYHTKVFSNTTISSTASTAHLAYQVPNSGCKTSIIIIIDCVNPDLAISFNYVAISHLVAQPRTKPPCHDNPRGHNNKSRNIRHYPKVFEPKKLRH